MNETKRIFDRNELYKQAWSKPMIKLAKEYGLSDNGLRKICKKLGVPLPGIGYWVKLEFGKKVVKPPLPQGDYPKIYQSISRELEPKPKQEINPELQRVIDFENLPENQIRVPLHVSNLHPLVKQAKQNLKEKQPDYKSILESSWDYLDIKVSRNNLHRSFRFYIP